MDPEDEHPAPAPTDEAQDRQAPGQEQPPAETYRFTDWASI